MAAPAELLEEDGDWGLAVDKKLLGLILALEVVDCASEDGFGLL